MEEILKKIDGYENYSVSNIGNVRNDKTGLMMKPNKSKDGYFKIGLSNNGIKKTHKIHHLVADHFLKDKRNGRVMVVDHINNIKTDNRVKNLQIITIRENSIKDLKNIKPNKTSKYIGVHYNKINKNLVSRILINGIRHSLGSFKTEEEAGEAYQNKLNEIKKEGF